MDPRRSVSRKSGRKGRKRSKKNAIPEVIFFRRRRKLELIRFQRRL